MIDYFEQLGHSGYVPDRLQPMGGACNCGTCNPFQAGYGQQGGMTGGQAQAQYYESLRSIMAGAANQYLNATTMPQTKLQRAQSYAAEVRQRKGWAVRRLSGG